MSALVSNILTPREKMKMPPVPIAESEPDSPARKSALKSINGDPALKPSSPFSRSPSKKKLKWSADKKQGQDSNSDVESNLTKSIKSALSSASASSFFNKSTNAIPLKKDGSSDAENQGSSPPSALLLAKRFADDNSGNVRRSLPLSVSGTLSEDESIPSTPVTPDKCPSNLSHAVRVVREIIATEKQYVKDLQDIIEGYLGSMRKEESPVSEENVRDLFMNIEEIYRFNKEFVEDLECSDDDAVEVAYCFVNKEEGFETYTEYCTKYPKSMEVLTDLTRQKETATFLQKIQMNLGHPLPLGSYLLKPVQRILKYHLLLQDIQKHFDKENDQDGYDTVSDALDAMQGVAHYINEMKRQHEAALHVQEIQSQLSDFEGPDLTTYGNLVLEDSFRVVGTRTDRYLFLFERILLITKKRENGYTCKATLLLSNMMLTEAVPKEPLAFTIIRFDNQKVEYSFAARNADHKNQWTLELKRLLLESLAASVPIKAKNLILGGKSVDDDEDSESRKKGFLDARSSPRRHSFRGSTSSPAKKADKNNNVNKEEAEAKIHDVLSEEEKTPPVSFASDTPSTPSSPPTSPQPVAEPVSHRVEEWERRGGVSDDAPIDAFELEDDAFLPPSLDRRRSAEDILAASKARQSEDTETNARAVTSDSELPDAAYALPTPWVPVRSSSLKRMEARLSLEKCMSDGDLREMLEMNSGLAATDSNREMTKHIDNFSDNSKIQKTVRDVSKAFNEPALPARPRPTWDSSDASDAIIAPLVDVFNEQKAKTRRKSSTLALDDLLESIDRELDETRRTISNAQLLESALRLKREPDGTEMESEQVDRKERTLADRISAYTAAASGDQQAEVSKTTNHVVDLAALGNRQTRAEMSNVGHRHGNEDQEFTRTQEQPLQSTVESSTTNTLTADEEAERDLKAELASWVKQTVHINSLFPVGEKIRTSSLDRRRGKKVFEMPHAHKFDRYSAGDFPLVEAEKPSNVYRMARQYSRRVSDENKVRDIRSRSKPVLASLSSSSESSPTSPLAESPSTIDRSPRIKVQRVTKVTFDDLLEEKRVIRRRRKPGHSARDQKRASWSFEKSKPEMDGLQRSLKRERPRSLHEIKPAPELIEFEGEDNEMFPDGLEEGLMPAMLAGMEKDDIVVKGLVKHLVNKFNPDIEDKEPSKPGPELL